MSTRVCSAQLVGRAGQAAGRLGVWQGRAGYQQGMQAGLAGLAFGRAGNRAGRQEDLADIGEKTQNQTPSRKNQYSRSEYLDNKGGQLLISSKSRSHTSTRTPSKSSTAHKSADNGGLEILAE
ncbi:hypothetical protein PPACK8108_LOCUS3578 [Phakopsora pachyrhizi]|uniref:Uncharacterized protein n=1 Tax=Phakopsora pachyrhizi TaxID=170000 RepID=A0AAV0AM52_PHAPC|nr:hypothetical protein PPACK8108_LOCUS3578 [Phakopsora pachyrhizi]